MAVTGHSEVSYVERALDSGMNLVLPKPVKADELKDVVVALGYNILQQKLN